jgi:mRNA-degrading endonuclease RelE of RelBE toxin-antitoxin system
MLENILNIPTPDIPFVKKYRELPIKYKKTVQKFVDELLEQMDDEQDLKDARARMKEKTITASKVYKKIGI